MNRQRMHWRVFLLVGVVLLGWLAAVPTVRGQPFGEGIGLIVGRLDPASIELVDEVARIQRELGLATVIFTPVAADRRTTPDRHALAAMNLGLKANPGWKLNLDALQGRVPVTPLATLVTAMHERLGGKAVWLVDGSDPSQIDALVAIGQRGVPGLHFAMIVPQLKSILPPSLASVFSQVVGENRWQNGAQQQLLLVAGRSFEQLVAAASARLAAGEAPERVLPPLVAQYRASRPVAASPRPVPVAGASSGEERPSNPPAVPAGETPLACLAGSDDQAAQDRERSEVEQQVMTFLRDEVHDLGTLIALLPELTAGDVDPDRLAEFGLGLARRQPGYALAWLEALDQHQLLPTAAVIKKGLYQVLVRDADLSRVAEMLRDPSDRRIVRMKLVLRALRSRGGATNPSRVAEAVDDVYGSRGLVARDEFFGRDARQQAARQALFAALETLDLVPDFKLLQQCRRWPEYRQFEQRQRASRTLAAGNRSARALARPFAGDRSALGAWVVEHGFAAHLAPSVIGDLARRLTGIPRAIIGEMALAAFSEAGRFDGQPALAARQVRRLLPGDLYDESQIRQIIDSYQNNPGAGTPPLASGLPATLFHWTEPELARAYEAAQRITQWGELVGDHPEKEGDGWRGPSLVCEDELVGGQPGLKVVRIDLESTTARFLDVQRMLPEIIRWMLPRPKGLQTLDAYLRVHRVDVFRCRPERTKAARYHVINPAVIKGIDASSVRHFELLLERTLDGRLGDLAESYPALAGFADLMRAVNVMEPQQLRQIQSELMRICLKNLLFDPQESSFVLRKLKQNW